MRILATSTPHPVPLQNVLRSETHFCVDEHTFGLARVDAPGRGVLERTADGGLSISADAGGTYVLVDEAMPTRAVSGPLYFARPVPAPILLWPRFCEEVHRLSDTLWACDGILFDGASALPDDGTQRWLPQWDGAALAARRDGIFSLSLTEIGTDAGRRISAETGIEGWDNDDGGLSFATDSGFVECPWDQPCRSLGPRFGTGDLPLDQQRLIALMRRDGHTFFSLAPAARPFCEAQVAVQSCSSLSTGGFIAARGDLAWVGSIVHTEGSGPDVSALAWDGGWSGTQLNFPGPLDFGVAAGVRARTPSRVIFMREDQVLFWQWDAPGEPFELVEVGDAGTQRPNAGASPGFFWVSMRGPGPRTLIFSE